MLDLFGNELIQGIAEGVVCNKFEENGSKLVTLCAENNIYIILKKRSCVPGSSIGAHFMEYITMMVLNSSICPM